MEEKKLNVKDLINIGLFTALYFICFYAVGMTGYVPIMMLLLPFMIAVVGGIPVMLFITKVPKFGALSIMGIIVSFLMFLTGHPWPILVFGIPLTILGDFIASRRQFKSWFFLVAGYSVFSLWSLGALYPLLFMKESYLKSVESGYGTEYAKTLNQLFSVSIVPWLFLSVLLGGIIGAYLGRSVLKKHFKRAGIAG